MSVPPLFTEFPGQLPPSMDFDALLAEGIGYVQATSGDDWTDYNEHDPGLTILEQLSYALTDLGLRSQYDIADLLADEKGAITRDTLFTGDRILTTAPITSNDYRKLIYDRVIGLKNVWLEPVKGMPGQYCAWIEKFRGAQDQVLTDQVKKILRANRTLCEDVDDIDVVVLKQQPLKLEGVLELMPGADPDEVMGSLLFDLDWKLVPPLNLGAIDVQIDAGRPLDEIYEGPQLESGTVEDGELAALPTSITSHQIANVVHAIPNVRSLTGLHILGEDNVPIDTLKLTPGSIPFIDIPQQGGPWPFEVVDSNRAPAPLDAERVLAVFLKCVADARTREDGIRRSTDTLSYRRLPTGRDLKVQHYYSFQHQFPVTYGLSHYGLAENIPWRTGDTGTASSQPSPEAVVVKRRALVEQLRAYLMLYDQVLANAFAQLANVRWLFSLRPPLTQSYFVQSLMDEAQVDLPDVKHARKLLRALPDEVQERHARRWRYIVCVHQPAGIVLRSVRIEGLEHARQLARTVAAQCTDPANYTYSSWPGGHVSIALVDAERQPIAYGQESYRTLTRAQRAARRLALRLRQAEERGEHRELDGPVSIRRQGAIGMRVKRHTGELVLSAYWPGTLAERHGFVEEVLRCGSKLDHYRYRQVYGGQWHFLLFNEQGAEIAIGQVRADSLVEIERSARGVAHLLGHIRHNRKAFVRHVQLVPGDDERPKPPIEERHLAELRQLMAQFDDYPKRRNALLNHLLARFNERFDDELLQRFDPRPAAGDRFLSDLANCKSSFLMAYPCASSRRASGFDYSRKTSEALPFGSGIEQRLYSLLAIGGSQSFARYRRSRAPLTRHRPGYGFQFSDDGPGGARGESEAGTLAFETDNPTVFAHLLKYGADFARYRIDQEASGKWALYFLSPTGDRYHVLSDTERARLETHRNNVISWLHPDGAAWQKLFDGEGLYVLEHILLRPLAEPLKQDDGFYGYRISVLLPNWPIRFQSDEFKRFGERLARENCPAHIAMDCYWLDFHQMAQFEHLYEAWARAKYASVHGRKPEYRELDTHSQALRQFLQHLAQQTATP